MAINEHVTTFAGQPVRNFNPRSGIDGPAGGVFRVRPIEGWRGTPLQEVLARFLADPRAGEVAGLVIGSWRQHSDHSGPVVEALVAARDRLAGLRALFLGDIVRHECELSWIEQCDLSPHFFPAFPLLEELRIRGTTGLRLGPVRHDHLRSLAIESGGLERSIVHDLAASHLPALESLVLWLGMDDYGGDTTVADLAPILSGTLFPQLTYLGLCDSFDADDLAEAVVNAQVVRQLEVLDLSLGNLSDTGARALLGLPTDARLRRLNIHHHYVSEGGVAQLHQLPFEVDAGDPQEPDGPARWDRYIAHSE